MPRMTQTGDRIGAVTLSDVDGTPVELSGLLTAPLIIPMVRYYGCMPCQAYLRELETHREQLVDWGFDVVGVGGAADYQAERLMNNGVEFPLLLDRLYETVNIHHIHWWKLLSPLTWWKYLRSARHARQGRITNHPLQAPGSSSSTRTAPSGTSTAAKP